MIPFGRKGSLNKKREVNPSLSFCLKNTFPKIQATIENKHLQEFGTSLFLPLVNVSSAKEKTNSITAKFSFAIFRYYSNEVHDK